MFLHERGHGSRVEERKIKCKTRLMRNESGKMCVRCLVWVRCSGDMMHIYPMGTVDGEVAEQRSPCDGNCSEEFVSSMMGSYRLLEDTRPEGKWRSCSCVHAQEMDAVMCKGKYVRNRQAWTDRGRRRAKASAGRFAAVRASQDHLR